MPSKNRSIEELTCDIYNNDPTRVRRVAKTMPTDETFEHTAHILKAVADPVRLRVLYALTKEPLCVCELSTLLNMSLPAVSHHLRLLYNAGLLKVQKEGKFACYSLRQNSAIAALLQPILHQLEQTHKPYQEKELSLPTPKEQ